MTYALACRCGDCRHWEVLAATTGFSGGPFWHHPDAVLRCVTCGRLFDIKITVDKHAHLSEVPLTDEETAAMPSRLGVPPELRSDTGSAFVPSMSTVVVGVDPLAAVETALVLDALASTDSPSPIEPATADYVAPETPDAFSGGEGGGAGGGADFGGDNN